MSYVIVLRTKGAESGVKLTVTDSARNHKPEHGGGRYITLWWQWLEARIFEAMPQPWSVNAYSRYGYSDLRQEQFDTIPDQAVGLRAVLFTNMYYKAGLTDWMRWPDYEEVRHSLRTQCQGCAVAGAWTNGHFTCQSDCAGYTQLVAAEVSRRAGFNQALANEAWTQFMNDVAVKPIKPPWLKPGSKRSNLDVRLYRMRTTDNHLIPL